MCPGWVIVVGFVFVAGVVVVVDVGGGGGGEVGDAMRSLLCLLRTSRDVLFVVVFAPCW